MTMAHLIPIKILLFLGRSLLDNGVRLDKVKNESVTTTKK